MQAATRIPSTRSYDLQELIFRSEEFVREKILAVLRAEPKLQVGPIDYAHTVKFPGSHPVKAQEIIETIRKEIDLSNEVTTYAHLPVCRYHCSFCHYPTLVSHDPQASRTYIDLLIAESEIFRRAVPEVKRRGVSSLYVGGGTPTLAEDSDLLRLMEYFRGSYELSKNAEITIEATPETLVPEKIAKLSEIGFSRVSVGVQVLDDIRLAEYHRQHTVAEAIAAVQALLEAQVFKVNVDLIYGLPNQSIQQFAHDVHQIAQLQPTSVTLYRLRLQRSDELGKTAMSRQYAASPELFPTQEITYAMQMVGRQILLANGYIERPSGWFTLAGNTIRVYDDRWYRQLPLIAFGWWTYSYSGKYEYRNHHDMKDYRARINRGQLPIEECYGYDAIERCRRFFQFRLKSCYAVHLADMLRTQENRAIASSYYSRQLDQLVGLGLANRFPDTLLLTDVGKVMIEEILSALV